jgi:hypothetical protein
MKPLHLLLLLIISMAAVANDKDDAPEGVPLFDDDEILTVTITAPFDEIMKTRSLEEELPGTFVYRDTASGKDVSLDIKIRARGKFRRQKENCSFAPLRLNFRKSNETLFANSDKLKLVTHCRNRSNAYEQSVYKEYLAYRILNILTDWSFRARLMQVRYVEVTDGEEVASAPAFLIEDDEQLAKRIGMKRYEAESTTIESLDAAHTNLSSVYQYLIGNTDFSPIKGPPGEPCCHNYVLMRNNGTQISVPYDFDVTGLSNPPHARPNPRFGLASVKQRLYRGRCTNNELLETTFGLFRDHKQEIYALVNNLQGLSKGERKKTIRYIDDFYKIIDSERQVNYRFRKACLGN